MKKTTLALALSLCFAAPAFAKKGPPGGTPQTHHCQKDGKEVTMTKKECLKAGGTWDKGAPAGGEAKPEAPAKPEKKADAPAKPEKKADAPAKKADAPAK